MLRRCIQLLNCGEFLSCLYLKKFPPISSKIPFSSFDKDLPSPKLPTPISKLQSPDSDILLDEVRKAKTVSRILELSAMHIDVMNVKHVVKSMELINILSRKENYETNTLIDNLTFQDLCSRLMKQIRLLEAQELIAVLKALTGLDVKSNTFIMQAVFKMIGSHLNDMTLGQLVFLNFLLSKQRHNSLVDGLRLALPLVLQVQIEQQLDSDNLNQVVDCFQLACRARLKPAVLQKVLSTVLDKAKLLNYNTAITVLFALLHLNTPLDGYKELLNYSFETITKSSESFDPKQILPLLRLCSSNNQYHSAFFFAAAEHAVTTKFNLEDTFEAMRYFYRSSFCPPKFLDHLVSAICLESETFRTDPKYTILTCVEYLTLSGYRPYNIEDAIEILCSCQKKIDDVEKKMPLLFIKFLSCLAMLKCFPENLLLKILNESYLYDAWSNSRKLGRSLDFERYSIAIAWSLDVYNQEHLKFPQTILQSLVQNLCGRFSNHDCPLQKFIENGLGGSQFVISGVFTKNGLLIDHVVAMRSGNYPVSLGSSVSSESEKTNAIFLEDLALPPDTKIITVIVAHPEQYCRDPEVLRGWVDLKIKFLVKNGYFPVVINYTVWRNLPDREKIPYLMQNIKQAIQEEILTTTNSLF